MAVGVVGASSGVNSSGVLAGVNSSPVVPVGSGVGENSTVVTVGVVGASSGVHSSGVLAGNGSNIRSITVQVNHGVVAVGVVGAESGVKSSGVLVSLCEDGDGACGQNDLQNKQEKTLTFIIRQEFYMNDLKLVLD